MVEKEMAACLAHIGIPTEMMAESRNFFESLGFFVLEDFKQPNGRPVIFMGSGNVVLEIYEGSAAGSVGAIDHIALNVTDLEAQFEKIKGLGYPALEGTIQLLDFGVRKVRYFTILGPDKEKVEFCQELGE